MESINSFGKGQVSDVSKIFQSKDSALQIVNMRGMTENGQSTGSLVNIKGNRCEIEFPIMESVYKFRINSATTGTSTFTITVNGQTTANINVNASTTTEDVYNAIKALSNCYQTTNGTPTTSTFAVAYNSDDIFIYQNPSYSTCTIAQSIIAVYIATITLTTTNYFVFTDTNGVEVINPALPPQYIFTQDNDLTIIGSTFIHETFYLYTCPTTNPLGLGQIWEMVYNETTKTTSIKLIYYNYIDFNTTYPIAPSATIGRYEIDTIQRIYWTDFNNPVRTLNIKDPQVFATPVGLLDLKPNVKFNIPVLSTITDTGAVNNLTSGFNYQCAYRLVKNNGAITNYSNPSNIVYLTKYSMAQQSNLSTFFANMQSSNGIADVTKQLVWEVNNIDTNYDKVEFVIIVRNHTGVYTLHKYDEQIINGQSTLTTVFRNDTVNMDEVTIEEFLIDNIFFSHCKTIEQKDNRLFFGNVKNELALSLDSFDTRVHRFIQGTNQIWYKKYENDTGFINQAITTNADYALISETADNIPLYNLGFDNTDDPLYNSGTRFLRLSNELGAEGPNIKVKFGSLLIRADMTPNNPDPAAPGLQLTGSDDDISSSQAYFDGYRKPGWMSNNANNNVNPINLSTAYQSFTQNSVKMTMGSEYLSGLIKSFQHNEIYRFGIVFYDKNGQESFVKWIGDIKMPDYTDTNSNGGWNHNGTVQATDFRSVISVNGEGAYLNVPYVQFEVNLPANLAELVGAYEIVRTKRNLDDRSIRGHGLLTQCEYGIKAHANDACLPIPYNGFPNGTTVMNPSTPGFGGNGAYDMVAFHCFDYLANNALSTYLAGDRLLLKERYNNHANNQTANPGVSAILPAQAANRYYIEKYYHLSQNYGATSFKLLDIQYAGLGATTSSLPPNNRTYLNYCMDTVTGGGGSDTNSQSIGCPTHIFALDSTTPMFWQNYNAANNNSKLLGIHVRPSLLRNQYGGRTYLKRAESEYISTGCYQTVSGVGTTVVKTYGGDIYHGILDIQKAIKNWGQTGRGNTVPSGNKCSQTWFFGTQGIYNIDLRYGTHINRNLNDDGGNQGATLSDEYGCHDSFTFDNEVKKYYPKPIFFNETNNWDNRIYWSEVKINGELNDSWASILTNSYYDVDGNYGPINALIALKGNMFFLQDRSLGNLMINQVSLTTDQNNQEVLLGRGDVLTRHNYLSIDAGTKHQWSVYRSQNAITFVDARNKKAYLYNGQVLEPISDTKSNRNYFLKRITDSILTNDNPILRKGILTTYDYFNDEFLYTFLDTHAEGETTITDYNTIAFSGLTMNFIGMYSFAPYIYINNNSKLYSSNSGTDAKAWLHNYGNYGQFYGTTYKSSIKVLINDNPLKTKIFDNLSWITESIDENSLRLDDYINTNNALLSDNVNYLNDTFKTLRCYNEYQNTDWSNLLVTNPITNLRKSEQGWNTIVPRNKVNYNTNPINTFSIFNPAVLTRTTFGDRMRDKYMIVDLEYDNALNNTFIAHNLSSIYRISDR